MALSDGSDLLAKEMDFGGFKAKFLLKNKPLNPPTFFDVLKYKVQQLVCLFISAAV